MSRLIDADALPKYTGYALSATEVAKAVESAPTVDAVEVVRCKDCKWWKEETEYDWDGVTVLPEQWCTAHDCYIKPDGFCSWGERREDG